MNAVLETPAVATVTAPTSYLLHLADNAVVLGQRNAEWCGHGPMNKERLATRVKAHYDGAGVRVAALAQARIQPRRQQKGAA